MTAPSPAGGSAAPGQGGALLLNGDGADLAVRAPRHVDDHDLPRMHIVSKLICGRLLSYLNEQSIENGSRYFTIPFSRQQLTDYLNVDRSALSNELSKMQKDGLIDFHRSDFYIKEGGFVG